MAWKLPRAMRLAALALLGATALAGCQGGAAPGHEPGATAFSAEGLWRGVVSRGDTDHEAWAVVFDGELLLGSAGNGVYDGRYRQTGDAVDGVLHFAGQGPDGPVEARLWVGESDLRGELIHAGARDAAARLHFDPAWFRDASRDRLAGAWADLGPGSSGVSLGIDPLGRIHGSDVAGCHYTGDAWVPLPGRNLYRVELTVETCGPLNGPYRGFATLASETARDDRLDVILAGPAGALDWRLHWQ